MQAILLTRYGPPDLLELRDIPVPVPAAGQVLVKVHAASANPVDWHLMRGSPILVRLMGGFLKPKDPRLGADLAGRVEAVGPDVTGFQPGDLVFGRASDGSFAEYAIASQDKLARIPPGVSFESAAACPVSALTALQGVRDRGRARSGQKVLVNGAAGGIGSFGVQIAKSLGAEVTGVCRTNHLDLVRSIGADHVVDYTGEDFTRLGHRYDLIFDAVGNRSGSDLRRALTPEGACIIAGYGGLFRILAQMLFGSRPSRPGSQRIEGLGMARINQADLVYIAGLLASGQVVPAIDRRYPLAGVPEALGYLEQGHAGGKVIITVDGVTGADRT